MNKDIPNQEEGGRRGWEGRERREKKGKRRKERVHAKPSEN